MLLKNLFLTIKLLSPLHFLTKPHLLSNMQDFICHNSGSYTLASHNRGLGSVLGEFICSVDEETLEEVFSKFSWFSPANNRSTIVPHSLIPPLDVCNSLDMYHIITAQS
jgi:hypothetical protein